MTEAAFRAKRRQKFLTEKYFALNSKAFGFLMSETLAAIAPRKLRGDLDPFGEGGLFRDKLGLFNLNYTAGETIQSLKPLYADAIVWFEKWHAADIEYTKYLARKRNEDLRLDMSPLDFENLFDIQLAYDVVSLGVLLGEGDLLRRAIEVMNGARGTDLLYESLIAPAISDPRDNTDFFHARPYEPLIDAFYTAETPDEAADFMKRYLEGWYKGFEGAPWHNGHLVVTDEYSNYEGYWAFDAAAICIIHGIDDSSFRDHIVYPKDLADWARSNHSLARLKPGSVGELADAASRLRCEAGQPCPREGWWFSPARPGSRHRFALGDVMPELGGDYGATIWQWDEQQ